MLETLKVLLTFQTEASKRGDGRTWPNWRSDGLVLPGPGSILGSRVYTPKIGQWMRRGSRVCTLAFSWRVGVKTILILHTLKRSVNFESILARRRLPPKNERTNLICLPWRVKQQTKQICLFVFRENLWRANLLSKLTDLYSVDRKLLLYLGKEVFLS